MERNIEKYKKEFAGQAVIITGGANGIGKGIAITLCRLGCDVFIIDIDLHNCRKLASEMSREGYNCGIICIDVNKHADLSEKIKEISRTTGKIDIFVHCAGISSFGEFADMDEDNMKKIISTNLTSTVIISRTVYDIMYRQGYGRMVAVSSAAGLFVQPLTSIYNLTKHAMNGFFSSLYAEAECRNISVSLICPGYIDTGIYDNSSYYGFDGKEILGLSPFKLYPIDKAVMRIIKSIMKKKRMTVFPFHAVVCNYINRFFPGIWIKICQLAVRMILKHKKGGSYVR